MIDYPKDFSERLINDAEIANLLSISRSWVRKQRFNRRHGLAHVFDIEPIMVGSVPRYRLTDVSAWVAARVPANDNETASKGRAGK